MNQTAANPQHPLMACADAIDKALAAASDCDPAYLPSRDRAEFLLQLTRLISQQEALKLRAVAVAGDVAADHGCRTVADWIAPRTGTDKRAAFAQEKLAHALDERWHQVAGALADGRVHLDQARVIVKALDALPADVSAEVRQRAERRLVEDAEQFGPTDLARLGRRVLDVIAPEVGDEQERRALERAEAKAESVTRLDFKRRGDGYTDIPITVPDATAARLRTYLESFTSPRQQGQGDGVDPATGVRLPADRQRGLAFCALLERLDPDRLPDHGGQATTVMVTIPWRGLQSRARHRAARHRRADHRRRGPPAGLHRRPRPRRPRHQERGPRPRPHRPALLPGPAQGPRPRHPECRAEGCTVPGTLVRGGLPRSSRTPSQWSLGPRRGV